MNDFTNLSFGDAKRRQILKGFGVEEPQTLPLEKGRKPDAIGTRKNWGGKEYVKTANGWRTSAEVRDAHDKIHKEEKKIKKGGYVMLDEKRVKVEDVDETHVWVYARYQGHYNIVKVERKEVTPVE